ncbi:MAG: tRNA pseudouridine(38-40) synthase TruA [Prolixibacteraceae bacterium]|nr:tRNA pseudouridine(38-40) synthase TruA [Prolixibacteraceae bacterium]MBN2774985.1 tRNA pseudouridine(38-40) synthase TruA [Prolixibacteraceae bacterium]
MNLQRYFIQLSYKGTNYHGWQVQPNATSVQEVMERALSTLLREEVAVTGAGRTDTGVHASFFVAHFDSVNSELDNEDFVYRLNNFLPNDIAVKKVWKVPVEAHARFDALSRTYKYFISREKDPFSEETTYRFLYPLNIEKMNKAAKCLFDYTDFTSFSKLHSDVKTNNCKVMFAEWKEEGSQLIFTIQADRFLRNMVRAIVGTLLEVGKGKIEIEDFKKIIDNKDRGLAGTSAPAHGLFLTEIGYPKNLFID